MAHAPIRLRVTAAAEGMLRRGHPWLYATSIREQNRTGQAGDLAVVYDRQDKFLAIGLWDPGSPLRLRVLHRGKPQTLTEEWWRRHLDEAVSRRASIQSAHTTGLRLVHGENDGWPGLVLDRYGEALVIKLYTAAWLPQLEWLTPLVMESLRPERLVLRLSRNIQEHAHARHGPRDGSVLHGPPLSEPLRFLENGIWFEADVLRGQKTGFFLDQRDNRQFVESIAAGRDVLNAFSYSGGFSLYAARGGARSATNLDISGHALRSAARNMDLNRADERISRCPNRAIQADVFNWLGGETSERYDLIVLDPPSLARREVERAGAIRAYRQLAHDAVARLRPGGILVACSCSAHVGRDEFFSAVQDGADPSRRSLGILRTSEHPPDHAPTFAEAHYLKCICLGPPGDANSASR